MNWKRALFSFFAAFSLVLFFAPAKNAFASTMTSNQVASRFLQISQRYDVGDTLSDEDARFVLAHGLTPDAVQTRASKAFSTTGSGWGTSVSFSGTFTHTGSVANYEFGGTANGKVLSGSTPRSMKTTISCTSYGLVNGQTVLMSSGSVTHSVNNSKSISMNKTKKYTGFVVAYYMTATLDVVTSGGNSFNVVVGPTS